MRIVVHVNGFTYKSAPQDDLSKEDAAKIFYENISGANKFNLTKDNGDIVILPEVAVKSAIFEFIDDDA